ncbi:MAG: lipoate--protein ligase family protein, partial [Candidatus Margulisbacteria bacterium]|nr:lipoate--protein ligase family protein [Candidatus Margulisiibacteriota bacterium]
CEKDGIPILRRCSGGGTVVQGPGCLNYAVILRTDGNRCISTIQLTNEYVLGKNGHALSCLVPGISIQGISDLVIDGNPPLKVSGNAQKRIKNTVLVHGTFLLDFNLSKVASWLKMPTKQPDYRGNRDHLSFITNLGISAQKIKEVMIKEWIQEKI